MRANRWGIAVVGVLIQVALGGVYAWSVFRTSLAGDLGWTISEVSRTFTISIVMFGVASFFGGLWLSRTGSQTVAITGGLLYGVGVVLAGRSDHGLWWLYLTYGVVGGIGLGLAYIVPVAVLVKWFPDRRGLITGIAVGGFGAGALVESAGGARLLQSVGVLPTFACLGAAFLIVTMARGFFMRSYGLMLTAWGFASAFGPLLIAHMRHASGSDRGALHVIAGAMLVSLLLPLIVSPPKRAPDEEAVTMPGEKARTAA